MIKESLFGKTLGELRTITGELGLPSYAAGQIAGWLYKKDISSIAEMTNLSKESRKLLDDRHFVGKTTFSKVMESADGTKKFLFPTLRKKFVETAYIPELKRKTLCLSTQVGCKRACLFCMTGQQGFQGNLTAGEIINQLSSIPQRDEVTNIVYMGMGEPLDNLGEVMKSLEILTSGYGFGMSPRRITVSTIGIIPAMREFLDRSNCHLAVSMNSPFEYERRYLMPVENVYPIASVIEELKAHDTGRQRRISFEYILFKGMNDTPGHVREMSRILNGLRCRINLIRFHAIPGVPLESPDNITIEQFKEALNKKGILTTIRQSRGEDIYAACGMLSTRSLKSESGKDP